jgi:serine/threonine-protein kinase
VTVEEYRIFVRRSGAEAVAGTPSEQGNVPVTGITWDEAVNYCLAQQKRLPTEAEWEFAARGYTGRLYPWGERFIAEAVNSLESGSGQKERVSARPLNRSVFDVADLSGNVWQWCADDYGPYPGGSSEFPAGAKVIRGGSYRANWEQVSAVFRNLERPSTRSPVIGFRCAK